MKPFFYMAMALGALFEVAGDIFLKEWANGKRPVWQGLFLYTLGSLGWALCLKHFDLARGLVLFVTLNLVLGVSAGVFLFEEKLQNRDVVGLLLAVAAIACIEK